eukprot:4780424-Pyramimonas_sp.AAC.1
MRRSAAPPCRGHGPTSRAHKAAGAATFPPAAGGALPMSSTSWTTRTTESKRRTTRTRSTSRTWFARSSRPSAPSS